MGTCSIASKITAAAATSIVSKVRQQAAGY
jgi:hypothetical protein